MERIEKIFAHMMGLSHRRFEQSQKTIEEYCAKNRDEITAELISAFQSAFIKASDSQKNGKKNAARYLVISHLYSSVATGGYSIKLDVFDSRLYADPSDIEVFMSLDWLYWVFENDIDFFRGELVYHLPRLQKYEMDQVCYRYIYYYHSVVLKLVSENIPALMKLPEFQKLRREEVFEVMFGGYLDKSVVIGQLKGATNEILFN